MSIASLAALAEAIVNTEPVTTTYAACEWDELHEDGKVWITAIVTEAVKHGRSLEQADTIAQLRQSIAGADAIERRHRGTKTKPGVDITVYIARLKALIGTLEAGCHIGQGNGQ
jgi:hypothetical protein